jgi:predicted TIM-barrel fold metal-dependent hydrolase
MTSRREFIDSTGKVLMMPLFSNLPMFAAAGEAIAVDAHAHVFTNSLRISPFHRYIPHYSASLDAYLGLLRRFDFTNGVIIQPSFLGVDNSYLLACLKQCPDRLRGVIVIDPGRGLEAIDELHDAGCTGIRLNLFGLPDPPLKNPNWEKTLARMRGLGWHVELHVEACRIHELAPAILDAGVRIVVDHFGRPDPSLGIDDPGFHYLLSLARTRQVWVKISGFYRNGENGRGEQIALQAIPLFKSTFGLERMLWGSDWPHTQFEETVNYEVAYRFMLRMLPDEAERRVVLGSTPKELYRIGQTRRQPVSSSG